MVLIINPTLLTFLKSGSALGASTTSFIFAAILAPVAYVALIFSITSLLLGWQRTSKGVLYFIVILPIHTMLWLGHFVSLRFTDFSELFVGFVITILCGFSGMSLVCLGAKIELTWEVLGYTYFRFILFGMLFSPLSYFFFLHILG